MSSQRPSSPKPPRSSRSNTGIVLIVAAVVVAVVVGIAAIAVLVGDPSGNDAAVQSAAPKPTPSPPPPAGHTITSPVNTPPPATTPSNLPALNCSKPPALPAKPQQFAKPPDKSLAENAPPDGSYPSGTVAMARTSDPNSNGSQFFIVYDDTVLPTDGGGYSIFGQVVEGLDIVQAVAAQGLASDQTAPKQPVSILDI